MESSHGKQSWKAWMRLRIMTSSKNLLRSKHAAQVPKVVLASRVPNLATDKFVIPTERKCRRHHKGGRGVYLPAMHAYG